MTCCHCPQRGAGGCVEDLGLPPRFGWYIHHDGRRGALLRRTRKHDPLTGTVLRTAVTFECVDPDGKRATWSLACAGPAPPVRRTAPGGTRGRAPPAARPG
ncbi:hypothetical protein [Kitasatospora sp. NPDC018623]|uniref:hypothetical protein n=1 Tax=unclassified Kitasatospora TaxID=2633591 RepID=UPI0037ADC3BB